MEVNNFSEYWIYHLINHKKKITRQLHLAGFFMYLISWIPAIFLQDWRYIVGALVLGYLLSVFTHTFIEKSPVNLKHPYWGFVATMKMFSLMIRRLMDDELMRVFGKTDPAPEDNHIVDMEEEHAYQQKMSFYISDEIPEHPFDNYWDVFVMKHQNHKNIFTHVFFMYVLWALIITTIVTGELWPIILMPISMVMGNTAHKVVEDTYIDPFDAFAAPRAMVSLHKMMFLYTFGLYGAALKKRQDKLKAYLTNKQVA